MEQFGNNKSEIQSAVLETSLEKRQRLFNEMNAFLVEEKFFDEKGKQVQIENVYWPTSEEEKEAANKAWLKFKDAYETLTDPDKKLKYDSTFKFDDAIPPTDIKIKNDKDFFKKFGPVFIKNSIWSTRKPVPKIGDMNTDIKKVKKFYNFWFAFSSWRDFEIEGEHNLDEAENRWEKWRNQREYMQN